MEWGIARGPGIFLAGTVQTEIERGLGAIAEAYLYLVDLHVQLGRWADDGGGPGDEAFVPPPPPPGWFR